MVGMCYKKNYVITDCSTYLQDASIVFFSMFGPKVTEPVCRSILLAKEIEKMTGKG